MFTELHYILNGVQWRQHFLVVFFLVDKYISPKNRGSLIPRILVLTLSPPPPCIPDQTVSTGDAEESERVKVARELAETERRYCGTLWTIQDTFAEPLAAAEVVTAEEIRSADSRGRWGRMVVPG